MKKSLCFLIACLCCLCAYAQAPYGEDSISRRDSSGCHNDTLFSNQADTIFQNVNDSILLERLQDTNLMPITYINDSIANFSTNTDSLKKLNMTLRETLTFLKVIRQDLKNSPEDIKALKKECIRTYRRWFYSAFWLDLGGPLMWTIYFNHRNAIHSAIYKYCFETDSAKRELDLDYDNLDAFCNSYKRIRNGSNCEQYLKLVQYTKEALTKNQYRLFCYGECVNINGVGDTPSWYMPNCKSNYLRRLFFTGFRNAYVQGNMLNRTTGIITEVERTYDNLDYSKIFRNRGTGNTAAGQALEWYKDHNGKLWFFYINTKATNNRLFYFGAVGRNGRELGKYILRFELSSRTCEPVNTGKAKRHIND